MGTKNYSNATDLITFSRSSGGTALRKIAYGPELVTNGGFDTDTSGWTPNNLGLLSVDSQRLKVETGNPGSWNYGYQEVTVTPGKVYRFQAQSTEGTATKHRIGVGTAVQIGDILEYGSATGFAGDKTADDLFVATTSSIYISLQNNDGILGSYTFFDNVSVKEVLFDQGDLTLFNHPADIPRIEYDSEGNVLGLLVEESRTNLNNYSEDFSGWATTGVTKNNGVVTATAGSGHHRISRSFSVSSSAVSWFDVKAGTHSFITIYDGSSTNNFAYFDLSSGTVGSVGSNTTATIKHLGGNVYRCSCAYGSTNTPNGNCLIALASSATGSWGATFTATGTESVEVLRHQLELGAFPTSYIPTSGSTATRAADVASISLSDFGYNESEGTVVVEAQLLIKDTSYKTIFNLNTDGSNRIRTISGLTPTIIQSEITDGGSSQFAQSETITEGSAFKSIVAYKENNSSSSVNGSIEATDTACTIPAVTTLDIMTSMTGYIKKLKYFPRRLTNDQLQELTS